MADKKESKSTGYMVYVVPLKRVYWGKRTNRADRAIRFIRAFVKRHAKVDDVKIGNDVNMYIWSRSREKPPRRVKILVRVVEEEAGEEDQEKETRTVAVVRLAGPKLRPGKYKAGSEEKK